MSVKTVYVGRRKIMKPIGFTGIIDRISSSEGGIINAGYYGKVFFEADVLAVPGNHPPLHAGSEVAFVADRLERPGKWGCRYHATLVQPLDQVAEGRGLVEEINAQYFMLKNADGVAYRRVFVNVFVLTGSPPHSMRTNLQPFLRVGDPVHFWAMNHVERGYRGFRAVRATILPVHNDPTKTCLGFLYTVSDNGGFLWCSGLGSVHFAQEVAFKPSDSDVIGSFNGSTLKVGMRFHFQAEKQANGQYEASWIKPLLDDSVSELQVLDVGDIHSQPSCGDVAERTGVNWVSYNAASSVNGKVDTYIPNNTFFDLESRSINSIGRAGRGRGSLLSVDSHGLPFMPVQQLRNDLVFERASFTSPPPSVLDFSVLSTSQISVECSQQQQLSDGLPENISNDSDATAMPNGYSEAKTSSFGDPAQSTQGSDFGAVCGDEASDSDDFVTNAQTRTVVNKVATTILPQLLVSYAVVGSVTEPWVILWSKLFGRLCFNLHDFPKCSESWVPLSIVKVSVLANDRFREEHNEFVLGEEPAPQYIVWTVEQYKEENCVELVEILQHLRHGHGRVVELHANWGLLKVSGFKEPVYFTISDYSSAKVADLPQSSLKVGQELALVAHPSAAVRPGFAKLRVLCLTARINGSSNLVNADTAASGLREEQLKINGSADVSIGLNGSLDGNKAMFRSAGHQETSAVTGVGPVPPGYGGHITPKEGAVTMNSADLMRKLSLDLPKGSGFPYSFSVGRGRGIQKQGLLEGAAVSSHLGHFPTRPGTLSSLSFGAENMQGFLDGDQKTFLDPVKSAIACQTDVFKEAKGLSTVGERLLNAALSDSEIWKLMAVKFPDLLQKYLMPECFDRFGNP